MQQNDNHYINSDQHGHAILPLNPSDVNVHMEEQHPESHNNSSNHSQNHNNPQPHGSKMEQTVQTDSTKPEKKIKFRAKTGEIKITIALDGSTLYCCPECNLAFPQKSDIEQHLQIHIQVKNH